MSSSLRPVDYASWPRKQQDAYYRGLLCSGEAEHSSESPSVSFVSGSDRRFGGGDSQWREPTPLPDGLLPVPAFQPDYLPEAVVSWATDITDRMQCPLDFIGATALVALGAAIGRRIAIRPQRSTDWTEVPNL